MSIEKVTMWRTTKGSVRETKEEAEATEEREQYRATRESQIRDVLASKGFAKRGDVVGPVSLSVQDWWDTGNGAVVRLYCDEDRRFRSDGPVYLDIPLDEFLANWKPVLEPKE